MYEEDQAVVTAALRTASTTVFTDETISKILALTTKDNATVRFDMLAPDLNGNVTVTPGAEVVLVSTSDTFQSTVTVPNNAPVIIFQGKGGVVATINDGASTVVSGAGVTDRVVVGSAGNDRIILDHRNTNITLGHGDTVISGGGNDTIIAGMGSSTVQGGSGSEVVQLRGNASDYTVTVDNGHAIVTNNSTTSVTDISKIQYVQLDSGKALVFANDTQQAAVTTLYETAFGRTADAGGLQFWFDRAAAGVSLDEIAQGFVNSAEFQSNGANLDNTAFVQALYQQTFGRTAEDDGLAYWTAALETGGATRAQLIRSFADIAAHSIDTGLGETVVGSITIIGNII